MCLSLCARDCDSPRDQQKYRSSCVCEFVFVCVLCLCLCVTECHSPQDRQEHQSLILPLHVPLDSVCVYVYVRVCVCVYVSV